MFLGKIGAKSAAFINHKPFHPGTFENLERVWMAEEKHKKKLQKQKELYARREEEKKIHELRQALREKDRNVASSLEVKKTSTSANCTKNQLSLLKSKNLSEKENKQYIFDEKDRKMLSSRYDEDVYINGHKSVFGSLFCMESKKWGYSCCRSFERNSSCSSELKDSSGDLEEDQCASIGDKSHRKKKNVESYNEKEREIKNDSNLEKKRKQFSADKTLQGASKNKKFIKFDRGIAEALRLIKEEVV